MRHPKGVVSPVIILLPSYNALSKAMLSTSIALEAFGASWLTVAVLIIFYTWQLGLEPYGI